MNKKQISHNDLIKAFEYGIDYGLLIAEQERDSEEWQDAIGCYMQSRKTCSPTSPAPRRELHSETWRNAKKESMLNFIKMFTER
jgi:hypothetical protein